METGMKSLKSLLKIRRGIACSVARELGTTQNNVHNWAAKGSLVNHHGMVFKPTGEVRKHRDEVILSLVLKDFFYSPQNDNEKILRSFNHGSESQIWQHGKNENLYEILLVTNLSENPIYHDEIKFKPTVSYRSLVNGKMWSRPLDEFISRFQLRVIFMFKLNLGSGGENAEG